MTSIVRVSLKKARLHLTGVKDDEAILRPSNQCLWNVMGETGEPESHVDEGKIVELNRTVLPGGSESEEYKTIKSNSGEMSRVLSCRKK